MTSYGAYTEVPEPFNSFEEAVEHLQHEPGIGERQPIGVEVLTSTDPSGAEGTLVSGGESTDPSETQVFLVDVRHSVMGHVFDIKYIVVFSKEVENGQSGAEAGPSIPEGD